MRKIFCMVSLVILLFWMMPSGVLAEGKEAAKEKEIPSVVARVKGKDITADQYRNQWHILHRMRVSSGQRIEITPEYEESMKKEVVDRLIALELLRQEAVKKNLQADPLKVEEKVRELTDRMGAAGAMASAFSGQKPDLNAYRADITNSMNTQGLLKQEVYDKVTVEPKEVEDFYKANIKAFRVDDKRPAGTKPLNEVAPNIEALLRRQKAESLGKDYIEKLRAGAEIEKVPF